LIPPTGDTLGPSALIFIFPGTGIPFVNWGGKIFGNLSGRGWYGWGWSRNFEKRGYLSLEVRIDNSHQHKGGFMYDIQAFKERLG